MTAPDKIYAWSQENSQWGPQWKCCPEPLGPTVEFKRTQYTRSDLIQAMIDKAVADERERCAQVCDAVAAAFLSPEYATGQPISSFNERFACDEVKAAIRKGAKP